MDGFCMSFEDFQRYIEGILVISDNIYDGWKLQTGTYLLKKQTTILQNPLNDECKLVNFEYHIVYNISYSVPVLCFNISNLDGTRMSIEEYWKYNKNLQEYNMYDTLTQMDHPVLNQPILTLHPCKTQEILEPFLTTSKNPIISWLSVVSRFVHLNLLDDYLQSC